MLRRTSSPYVTDTSKGKSFNFSEWDSLTAYNNNSLIQDFVSYEGALYVCVKSVLAGDIDPKTDTNNGSDSGEYWIQVIKGIEGPRGKSGVTYVPSITDEGTLSWKLNTGDSPKTVNIKGRQGDPGNGLEFKWSGTKLLVRQEGSSTWTASPDLRSNTVYSPTLKNGSLVFEPVNIVDAQPVNFGQIKGKDGLSAYELAVKHGYRGSEANWLKVLEKGTKNAPKNIIMRVDSDPALFPDENYCGTHIQWKYDSDDYPEWNNLIQINQLMNLALAGVNLVNTGVEEHDGKKCYHIELNYNEIDYIDTKDNIVFGPKIRTISHLYLPVVGDGSVDPDQIAKVDETTIICEKSENCEKYFYISDPNNKGWNLTNNTSWVDATPGGADTAFELQEGKDSALTPCESATIDNPISGVGSTLVVLCVDENDTGSTRTGTINFTSSGITTIITINQKSN